MGAFAEHLRVVTERANPAIERRKEKDIPGGQMPVAGVLQNQMQHLAEENGRLRKELQSMTLAYETVDRAYESSVRCVSNQIEEVKRLTAERDAARAELSLMAAKRDMLAAQLAEANDRINWLHEASWQRAGVREDAEEMLIKTV